MERMRKTHRVRVWIHCAFFFSFVDFSAFFSIFLQENLIFCFGFIPFFSIFFFCLYTVLTFFLDLVGLASVLVMVAMVLRNDAYLRPLRLIYMKWFWVFFITIRYTMYLPYVDRIWMKMAAKGINVQALQWDTYVYCVCVYIYTEEKNMIAKEVDKIKVK